MPTVPVMLPSRRVFARLGRFDVECPKCGEVITATMDARGLPARLGTVSRRRAAAKTAPHSLSVSRLIFNPYTQRLKCPYCMIVWVVGLVIYPVRQGARRIQDPPADAVPDARQCAELRRIAGGWAAEKIYHERDEVNVAVSAECLCPPGGWLATCPLHGRPMGSFPAR